MSHCGGGVGPVRFGNDGGGAGPASSDQAADHDIFVALEHWVEQGVAPSRLVGSGPSPINAAQTMTRPLCPYPQQAQYKGSGDTNDAANFACALPAR
jgi:feruloyl esterase